MNMQAIRTLNRIWGPKSQDHAEAAYYDAKYDGGEFSGPANDHAEEAAFYKVLSMVAKRYQMTPEELENDLYVQEHVENDFYMKSLIG